MGKTRRRSIPPSSPDGGEQGTVPTHTKPKKPTAATNAAAIQELSVKVSGFDNQLTSITAMLTQLTSDAPSHQLSPEAPAAVPLDTPRAPRTPRHTHNGRTASASPLRPHHRPAGGDATFAGSRPRSASLALGATATENQPWNQLPGPRNGTRAQHFTNPAATAAYHSDQTTSMGDLDNDPVLARRVVEALHTVVNPYVNNQGRPALFPHQLVTRGVKKAKTTMGDLTLPEYLWAFIQMIRAKGSTDPDVHYMNIHLERVIEDAKTYDREAFRTWSEEICLRVSDGRVTWANTYEIDRLQGRMAVISATASKPQSNKEGVVYHLSEDLLRAKPAPLCKAYQQGSCFSSTDHVQNGYRHIHACTHCLVVKCQFLPHPLKDCKSKSFGYRKTAGEAAGFWNPPQNK